MSITEETPTLGDSLSFWDINGYSNTVKRVEQGYKQCEELMQLIQDRADVEKHYSKSLQSFAKKWFDKIEKGPEYASLEQAMKGVLREATQVAEIHLTVKEQLLNDVLVNLKQWKSESYHKSVVGRQLKESKIFDDDFKKAQKPWGKRLSKVKKAKSEHHAACKSEKSALNQENNSRADSSLSGDALRKLQDKSDKCKKEVEKTRSSYEASLSDLNAYNAKYMEDMTEIFLRTQECEERRKKFFKEMLFGLQKCLDVTHNDFGQIYQDQYSQIEKADYGYDLKWWSENHGVDMAMAWPVFEEYKPEFHEISKKKREEMPTSGITLRKINTDRYREEFSTTEYQTELNTIHHKEKKGKTSEVVMLTSVQKSDPHPPAQAQFSNNVYDNAGTSTPPPKPARLSKQVSYDPGLNPFGDEQSAKDLDEEDVTPEAEVSASAKEPESPPSEEANCDSKKGKEDDYDPDLNPFGDDAEDDEDDAPAAVAPPPPAVAPPSPAMAPPSPAVAPPSPAKAKAPPRPKAPPSRPPRPARKKKPNVAASDPFGDNDFYDAGPASASDGVPVRALFDYEGAEDDELSFKVGDMFIKLEDKDEQGWCKGLKDGRTGLYPDNYVELINT